MTPTLFKNIDSQGNLFLSRIFLSPQYFPYKYSGSLLVGNSIITYTNPTYTSSLVNLIPNLYQVRQISNDMSYDTIYYISVPETNGVVVNAADLIVSGSLTGSFVSPLQYAVSSSYSTFAVNAATASYLLGLVDTASYAKTASYAYTSSYSYNANTASYLLGNFNSNNGTINNALTFKGIGSNSGSIYQDFYGLNLQSTTPEGILINSPLTLNGILQFGNGCRFYVPNENPDGVAFYSQDGQFYIPNNALQIGFGDTENVPYPIQGNLNVGGGISTDTLYVSGSVNVDLSPDYENNTSSQYLASGKPLIFLTKQDGSNNYTTDIYDPSSLFINDNSSFISSYYNSGSLTNALDNYGTIITANNTNITTGRTQAQITLDAIDGGQIIFYLNDIVGNTGLYTLMTLSGSNVNVAGNIDFTGKLTKNNIVYVPDNAATASALKPTNNYVVNNLNVNGTLNATSISSSIINITSSNLNITDAYATLNTATPHQQYCGIQFYDSGSTNNTSFITWDGQNDYLFVSSSNGGYSRRLVLAPDNLGALTSGSIPVATTKNGLVNSIVTQTNSTINVAGNLVANSFTGSLQGTAATASYIDAGNITSGTLNNARLPSQISVTGVTASLNGTAATASALVPANNYVVNNFTANGIISSSKAITGSALNLAGNAVIQGYTNGAIDATAMQIGSGQNTTNANNGNSVIIGNATMNVANATASNGVYIGHNIGGGGVNGTLTNATGSVLIGRNVNNLTTISTQSVIIGTDAAHTAINSNGDTMVGYRSGHYANGSSSVFIGYQAGQGFAGGGTTNNSIFIGANADVFNSGVNADNTIVIGANAKATAANQCIIGSTGSAAVKVGIGTFTPVNTLDVFGNVSASAVTASVAKVIHYVGNSATPTIVTGSGAGSGATISIVGTDAAGKITFNNGTGGSTNAAVFTCSFTTAYAVAPYVVCYPANNAAASLSTTQDVYATSSTTTFNLITGATNLSNATTYAWYYHIIG